jgi:hypothetical protein
MRKLERRARPRAFLGAVRIGLIALGLMAAAGAATTVSAQQAEGFRITNLDGYVELGVENEREDRSRNGVTFSEVRELEFYQLLRLDLGSFVYHPRFLTMDTGFDLELIQRRNDFNRDVNRSDPVLVGGDWNLRFLEKHPYGFSIFGAIDESNVDPILGRSYDVRSESYGAAFDYRVGPLPFRASYHHRSRTGSGAGSDVDETADEYSALAQYRLTELSDGELEYFVTSEDIRGRSIDTQEFRADNSTYLDPELRKRFSTYLQLQDREEELTDNSFARGSSGFDWRHTDTLSTSYDLNFQWQEINDDQLRNWNLGASLSHQLWLSLYTTSELWTRFVDAPFGTTNTYGATLGEDYTKQLGNWGRISIGIAPFVELRKERPRRDNAFALDENVELASAIPVALNQVDITASSIRVTDLSGSIIYVENVDYNVITQGRVTRLQRTVLSSIGDPETVLVDYDYALSGPADFLTAAIDTRVSLRLQEALTLYWNFHRKDQNQLSGEENQPLERIQRRLVGARFSRDWMSVGVEFEHEDARFGEFHALSQALELFTPRRFRWRARLSGTHRDLEYTDRHEKVSFYLVSGTINARVMRRGWLEVEGAYRRERWSGGLIPDTGDRNDVDEFGLKASFTWAFRSLEAELGGRFSRLEQRRQEEFEEEIFLRVRRDF